MRIAFFVNSIEGEDPLTRRRRWRSRRSAADMTSAMSTPGDFVLRPDNSLMVRATAFPAAYKKPRNLS